MQEKTVTILKIRYKLLLMENLKKISNLLLLPNQ